MKRKLFLLLTLSGLALTVLVSGCNQNTSTPSGGETDTNAPAMPSTNAPSTNAP